MSETESGNGIGSVNTTNDEPYKEFFEKGSALGDLLKFLSNTTADNNNFHCDDVDLRILLIEQYDMDKDWDGESDPFVHDLRGCSKKLSSVVSQLRRDPENAVFKAKTYWNESIDAFRLDKKIRIENVWEVSGKSFTIKNGAATLNEKLKWDKGPIVQVVGVGDFESAMVLLSCCKFDIILLDTMDLFDFLLGRTEISTMFPSLQALAADKRVFITEELRNVVKLNRGPLDKYWVLPIVEVVEEGDAEDFHNKLREANVRTTDHRWNIGFDVDPINKPNEFLYRINEFIDLMLHLSVYHRDKLLTFLRYTSEDMRDRLDKMTRNEDGNRKSTSSLEGELYFEEYQDFMGAEYSNFMMRYGARKLIERDAKKGEDIVNKSLFATYVKEKFYNKFQIETELNRLMQSFYHQSATMFNDRYGRQRLRESFEALRNFIIYNGLGNPELQKSLGVLRCIIDSDFDLRKASKWVRSIK